MGDREDRRDDRKGRQRRQKKMDGVNTEKRIRKVEIAFRKTGREKGVKITRSDGEVPHPTTCRGLLSQPWDMP